MLSGSTEDCRSLSLVSYNDLANSLHGHAHSSCNHRNIATELSYDVLRYNHQQDPNALNGCVTIHLSRV